MSVNEQSAALSQDEKRLHELGYAQELRRRMSGFSNFAVSFTIISILSGCLTLYGFGMFTGGPVVIIWGWPFVGIMTLFVGLAMAEVCSSFPTAGGLYYWSAKLARRNGAAWSWFTGWFNFLGQVAVTAGIDFGAAFFINALLSLVFGLGAAHWVTVVIYAVVLLVHGLLNQFGIRLVALLNDISVWWHILGVLIIVAVLAFAPSHHQSASFVFGHFNNGTGLGVGSFYIILIGLLLAQYTFTGYDASAHMTEETHDAARSGPRGIVMSIVVSLIAGWVLLIGVTFAIQHYAAESVSAVPPAQIFVDAIGQRGAELLLLIVIGAQLFCGMSSVTANSRMIYAFSRDGALPFSSFWHRVNHRTRTPTNAIWLAAGGALILGLPYLWNSAAYAAVTSIAVIGLYIAYVTADVPAAAPGRQLPAGPLAPGPVELCGRLDSRRLGGDHHYPVHAAAGRPDHPEDLQLRRGCFARGHRLRRDLLAGLGAEVVHRAPGAGHAGGTGRDRAGSRWLIRHHARHTGETGDPWRSNAAVSRTAVGAGC